MPITTTTSYSPGAITNFLWLQAAVGRATSAPHHRHFRHVIITTRIASEAFGYGRITVIPLVFHVGGAMHGGGVNIAGG